MSLEGRGDHQPPRRAWGRVSGTPEVMHAGALLLPCCPQIFHRL